MNSAKCLPISRTAQNCADILTKYERAANDSLGDEQRKNAFRLTTLTYFGLPTLRELRKEEYRNELALDEKQTELIDSLYRQWLKEGLDLLNEPEHKQKKRSQSRSVIRPFNQKWDATVRREIRSTFSTNQNTRFDQLDFQYRCTVLHVKVFADDSLRNELNLTEEQRQTVDELIANLSELRGLGSRAASIEGYETFVGMLDEKQLAAFKSKLGRLSDRKNGLLPSKE